MAYCMIFLVDEHPLGWVAANFLYVKFGTIPLLPNPFVLVFFFGMTSFKILKYTDFMCIDWQLYYSVFSEHDMDIRWGRWSQLLSWNKDFWNLMAEWQEMRK